MKKLHFDTDTQFSEFLIEKRYKALKENKYATISVVGSFDQIRDIVEYLVVEGFAIFSVELENPIVSDYEFEYVLEFDSDGITVEKAVRYNSEDNLGEYFYVDGEGIYVLLPSKFPIQKANSGIFGDDEFGLHYVEIGSHCDCESCDCCEGCKDKEENSEDVKFTGNGIEISKDKNNNIHVVVNGNYKSNDEYSDDFMSKIDLLSNLLDVYSTIKKSSI